MALSIDNIESVQSFIFYLIQYSITNVNVFMVLIAMGYYLYKYIDSESNKTNQINNENDVEKTPCYDSPI